MPQKALLIIKANKEELRGHEEKICRIYQSVNYRRVNQQIANKVVEIGGKNITCHATTK